MTTPAISVVMAAYNGAALIEETLSSLKTQTFRDFEILVVDDRSTDDTLDVLARWDDPRLRVIALTENGGPVRARNRGFAEARGRYVAALDQDDLCMPERFARQVAYLDAHPQVVLLGTAVALLDRGATRTSGYAPRTTAALTRWLLQIGNPLAWSSVMVRADAARRLEPFTRPEILYAEDFDLYHRMARLGDVARLDEELLLYRVHAGGASQRYTETMAASATRVLAEAHAQTLGEGAGEAAALLVAHLMLCRPVPDRATLARLGAILATLQRAHLDIARPAAEDRRLIRWQTARRWAEVVRVSLRAGTIGLADAVAVRPDHLGLGHAGLDELLWARMIGAVRAARRARG